MEYIQDIIIAIRTIRAELNINPSLRLKVFLRPATEQQKALLWDASTQVYIQALARLEKYEFLENIDAAPKASASNVVQGCAVIVPLSGAVDLTSEVNRLDKEIAKLDKEITAVGMKLANESFVSRAPAEVVQRERDRAEHMRDARTKLETLRARFAEALTE